MQIQTARFGALTIADEDVLVFPDGLPAFEAYRRFVLVSHTAAGTCDESPFEWFQSVEDGALAFLTIRPQVAFPDYSPRIGAADLEAVGLEKGSHDSCLYVLLTVPKGDPQGMTANLMAPVVVNRADRVARQVIVQGDEYGLRHRLFEASDGRRAA